MGKTVLPMSQVIHCFFSGYRAFHRNLEPDEKRALEQMETAARKQIHASVHASFIEPIYPIGLSSVVEIQAALTDLERRVAALEEKVERL